jgi:hypothetical protein
MHDARLWAVIALGIFAVDVVMVTVLLVTHPPV